VRCPILQCTNNTNYDKLRHRTRDTTIGRTGIKRNIWQVTWRADTECTTAIAQRPSHQKYDTAAMLGFNSLDTPKTAHLNINRKLSSSRTEHRLCELRSPLQAYRKRYNSKPDVDRKTPRVYQFSVQPLRHSLHLLYEIRPGLVKKKHTHQAHQNLCDTPQRHSRF
jgi:hypothetical protein